jgi:dihydroorotate dehydrogenase
MYSILVRILFILPAETAHTFTMAFMRLVLYIPGVKQYLNSQFSNHKPVNLLGLEFKNKVGMAAGFDKNAKYLDILEMLGFGFIEIGTVTPKPQAGNDKPRLFRLIKDKALINRMGFNNDGVDIVYERLRKRKTKIIIGGNIGKNKLTPNEDAVSDYSICFNKLYLVCDYFVINVSSPNTPGLRALQDKEELKKIIANLMAGRNEFIKAGQIQKPILLKIAPDLSKEQLDEIIEVAHETKLDGLIATNTTISRAHLLTEKTKLDSIGAGGLSGAPLSPRATSVTDYLRTKTNLPIMATGGVMTVKDAMEKMKAGADLVQVYTGFIYGGPGLVKAIAKEI